jgi:hypothetical protein
VEEECASLPSCSEIHGQVATDVAMKDVLTSFILRAEAPESPYNKRKTKTNTKFGTPNAGF